MIDATQTMAVREKLEAQKKRRVIRDAVEAIREAVRSGRFTLGIYYVDDATKLQYRFFQAAFPYGDFGKIEEHFRAGLSNAARKRTAGVDEPDLAALDELLEVEPEEIEGPALAVIVPEVGEDEEDEKHEENGEMVDD